MARKQLDIADIREKDYLSERDLVIKGVRDSVKASQNLRYSGKEFLPYVKFGRSVRYIASAVDEYAKQHTITPGDE